MKALLNRGLILVLLMPLSLGIVDRVSAETGANPGQYDGLQEKWKLVKDKNGIRVYMRHTDGSRLKTFKGVKDFKIEDPYAMVAVLDDYESYPHWFHMVSKLEDLGRNSNTDRFVRLVTKLPWPVKDREAIAHVLISQDPETYKVRVDMHNDFNRIPLNKDYVRVPEYTGYLQAEMIGNKTLRVTIEAVGDVGGYIPIWIINWLASDIPYFSLLKLDRMIRRPEYQGHTFDYIQVPENW